MLVYHGCNYKLARKVVGREVPLTPSDTNFDWVGPGIYFWESDQMRAWERAQARCRDKSDDRPGVVGAIIDLRHCLDFLNRIDQDLAAAIYASMVDLYAKARRKLSEKNAMLAVAETMIAAPELWTSKSSSTFIQSWTIDLMMPEAMQQI